MHRRTGVGSKMRMMPWTVPQEASRNTTGLCQQGYHQRSIRPSFPAAPELTFLLIEFVSIKESNLIV